MTVAIINQNSFLIHGSLFYFIIILFFIFISLCRLYDFAYVPALGSGEMEDSLIPEKVPSGKFWFSTILKASYKVKVSEIFSLETENYIPSTKFSGLSDQVQINLQY